MNDNNPAFLSRTWFLTAGETDASGLMPPTLIASRAIEVATLHANALGIGYSCLNTISLGWVIARLSIEVVRYPAINETYTMTTWIEGYNRHFSDRCFEMTDADGHTVAHIRSVWVAMDTSTRAMADLSRLPKERFPLGDRVCPVAKCRPAALAPDAPVRTDTYTFRYTDLDFNRHVNTIRYLEAVLDTRDLAFHDTHRLARLEASFEQECHFGDRAELITGPSARIPGADTTIISVDGHRAVAVETLYTPILTE